MINDGSTDNSEEITRDIPDKRIKYIKKYKKNKGISVARNIGIKVARGKYIALTRNKKSRIPIRKEKINEADYRIKAKN